MQRTTYSASRGISFGLLGGLLGAIIMGGIAYMMPIPNTGGAPFFVAAAMMMGLGPMAAAAGWMLHLITGLIVGAIFGAFTSKVTRLGATTVTRGLGFGAIAGFIVWIVLFVPMMAMLMPALMSMGLMVGGSFAAHIIYGLILGATVGRLAPRAVASAKCEVCGGVFSTQDELKKHAKEAHMPKIEQQFKCNACGASFKTQAELMEHAKKLHPMPAH